MIIRLNVRDQLSRKNNPSAEDQTRNLWITCKSGAQIPSQRQCIGQSVCSRSSNMRLFNDEHEMIVHYYLVIYE